jgi:hypothetical protein
MRSIIVVAALIVSGLRLPLGVSAVGRACKSKTGIFTISCPAKWYLLFSSETSIDIVSFPPSERLAGVTIKDGGAEITVDVAPFGIKNVDSWIAADTKLVERSVFVVLRSQADRGVCRPSRAVDAQIDMGTNAIERDLSAYCSTSGHVYRVRLRAWKGDPKWPSYEATFLQTLRSLRNLP